MRPVFVLIALVASAGCTYDLCDRTNCGDAGGSTSSSTGGQGGGSAPVQVNVRFLGTNGLPIPSKTFLRSDRDGEVIETGTMDGSGEATFDAAPGEMVTVFSPAVGDAPGHVYSAQIAAGTSVIRFIDPTPPETPDEGWTIQGSCSCTGAEKVEFSGSGAVPFTRTYSGTGSLTHAFEPGSDGAPLESKANLYMWVYNAAGTVESFFSSIGVDKPLSGTITLDAESQSGVTHFDWAVNGAPDAYTIHRWMQNYQDGRHGYGRRTENTAATEQFHVPTNWIGSPTFFTEVVDDAAEHVFRHRKRESTFVDEARTVDASLAFPDRLASIDVTDPSRPVYSFSIEGEVGDVVQVSFTLTAGGPSDTVWTIAVPGAATGSVKVPVLPAELSSLGGTVPPNGGGHTNEIIVSQLAIPDGGYAELLDAGVLSGTGDREDLTEFTVASTRTVCEAPSGC